MADLDYLMLAAPYYTYNDPLRYEKAMLRRWFEARFGGRTYGALNARKAEWADRPDGHPL